MFGKTNWVLRGVRGAHAHAIYVLRESVILGRSANADIQILDRMVSREHARILVTSDEVLLEDLGSHNGTFVHGHQIHRRALRTGDKLSIGVSQYVIDQLKGRVLTSAIFLNKLTTKDTVGATAVKRRVAQEILTSATLEMPAQRATQELFAATGSERPSEQQTSRPGRSTPVATDPNEPEPAYAREQRERAVRLPTPMPGELSWSLHDDEADEADEAPNPQAPADPKPQAPEAPAVEAPAPAVEPTAPAEPKAHIEPTLKEPSYEDPGFALETVPLDPRSQRVNTPIPGAMQAELRPPVAPRDPPEPATSRSLPSEDVGHEAALRTIDAVVRLLKLRAKESEGMLLKIQDRENLRKLEGVLRESHRNKANRRRWTRLPCQLAANIGEQGSETAEARVVDIGAGGLRVSGILRVEPGDSLCIRVWLGEGRLARAAVFQTKVVWVSPKSDAFGVLFEGAANWDLAG